jgi:hypothetical protein
VFRAVSAKAGGFSSYDQHIALAAASRLAGCLLQQQRQQRDGQLLYRALELQEQFLGGLWQQSQPQQAETTLLGEIGTLMTQQVGATLGWLWVAGREGDNLLHCRRAWGVPANSWPTIEVDAVPPLLIERPFVLVCDHEHDRRLDNLIEGLAEDNRHRLQNLQHLVFSVAAPQGRLLAMFFLGVFPDRHISRAWINSVVQMLQPIGRTIVTARQFVGASPPSRR